jgi:hypothetical protein
MYRSPWSSVAPRTVARMVVPFGRPNRDIVVPPSMLLRSWERSEEGASFGGEGVVAAAACAMQPPDLSLGTLVRQRVKHGEQWGSVDAGADQEHRCPGRVEDEGTARRGDLDLVADF